MREKRHCCCCVPLPDGVMLVGIYGTAFHTGLLVIQVCTFLVILILLLFVVLIFKSYSFENHYFKNDCEL